MYVTLALGLVLVLLIYVFIWEPRDVKLTVYNVNITNLPESLDGFKIVQMTDFHRGPLTPDFTIKKAVQIANSTNADIAVLTGDFISYNSSNALPCAQMLSHIKTRLGSFAVLGNHDYSVGPKQVINALESNNITILTNKNKKIANNLYLIGIDSDSEGKPDIEASFKGRNKDNTYVMISHSPGIIKKVADKCGLLLTGHTHGGQFRLPFLSRQISHNKIDGKFIEGMYTCENIEVYVNRGIGMTNVPGRFCCSPEVSLFILHAKNK